MPDDKRDIKQEIQQAAGLDKPPQGAKIVTKPAG